MDYDILADAESHAFWVGLDGETFAQWILGTMPTLEVEGHDIRIEDYFTAEELKSVWDDAQDTMTLWLGKIRDTKAEGKETLNVNVLSFWMSMGIITGFIRGRTHEVI